MRTLDYNALAKEAITDHRKTRWYLLKLFLRRPAAIISLTILILAVLVAVFAPLIAPYPDQGSGGPNLADRLQAPSLTHVLGADTYGRDILSRIIYGSRVSIFGGFSIVLLAALFGVPLGIWAGYREGMPGAFISRLVELVLSFPALLLAIAISLIMGASSLTACVALVLPWWPWYTRLAQGEAMFIKHMQYVEAAQMLGYGRFHIMFRHILPNIMTPLIVMMLLDLGPAIISIGLLSFLSLGTQPPAADWGLMVYQGMSLILSHWWIAIFPGLAMFFVVTSFNIFGDTLKEILDPNIRKG
jgi:peptide/nickel transport system permease protein